MTKEEFKIDKALILLLNGERSKSDTITDIKAVIQQAIASHDAGKTVIRAKALRKKGTNEWYYYTGMFYNGSYFKRNKIPQLLSQDDINYISPLFPEDAELVDTEITYRGKEGE